MEDSNQIQRIIRNILGPDDTRRLLLTPKETAKLLRRAEQTLANDRAARRGLPYVKNGRSVRYLLINNGSI